MSEYMINMREKLAEQIIKNMKKRNMDACFCKTKEDALEKAISYCTPGCSVGWGGSESLVEIGFLDYLNSNKDKYTVIDRFSAKTPEEKRERYAKTTLADLYFMSSNAITKDGMLVNMDGSGNRVASLAHGPEKVVLVIGMNKVCATLEEAQDRIHLIAAPANTPRVNANTPCSITGECADCLSKDCICASLLITRFNRVPGRIQVILVGEDLGF